jgi:hypothetical protein
MLSLLLAAMLLSASPDAAAPGPVVSDILRPDVAVVCPADFREAMAPWIAHRRQQGHVVAVLDASSEPGEVRRRIRQVAEGGRLRFVVLVGDAPPDGEMADPARHVPTHHAPAKVNVLWGSEPRLATDEPYADLRGDGRPDVALGRLSAATPEQLALIVRKTLDYERSVDFGPWRRRLNLVAGVGGFGALADAVIESSARYFITQGIPAAYQTSMTYGSWRSAYCPDPWQFHATTLRRLNEGAWFWVYIGHGQPDGLDRMRTPGGDFHVFDSHDVSKLDSRPRAPVAFFMCCYVGAFDFPDDCLAERMLREPGGPVAVLAGSRVTMPYGMTVLAAGLLDECFQKRRDTLGEAILHAKHRLLDEPGPDDRSRAVLDAVARTISPAPKLLAAERAEHALLFNLLGDPLLRLRHPATVDLDAPDAAEPGARIEVSGASPVDGRATVELLLPRGLLRDGPPRRPHFPRGRDEKAVMQQVYDRANDGRLARIETQVVGGRLAASLDVPPEARGKCLVCVFVEGDGDFALGAAEVNIARTPR